MKHRLSALMDGELDDEAGRVVLDALARERELRTDWDTYCLVGDVLRGEHLETPDLVARVMGEIDAEPTLLAPPRSSAGRAPDNGPWRALMPLAASLMGVAAVGWVAQTLYSEPDAPVTAGTIERVHAVASGPQAPVVPVASAAGTEDPHREYVFAHQAMTAGGPIPGAVQYVRTVSVTGQDGDR